MKKMYGISILLMILFLGSLLFQAHLASCGMSSLEPFTDLEDIIELLKDDSIPQYSGQNVDSENSESVNVCKESSLSTSTTAKEQDRKISWPPMLPPPPIPSIPSLPESPLRFPLSSISLLSPTESNPRVIFQNLLQCLDSVLYIIKHIPESSEKSTVLALLESLKTSMALYSPIKMQPTTAEFSDWYKIYSTINSLSENKSVLEDLIKKNGLDTYDLLDQIGRIMNISSKLYSANCPWLSSYKLISIHRTVKDATIYKAADATGDVVALKIFHRNLDTTYALTKIFTELAFLGAFAKEENAPVVRFRAITVGPLVDMKGQIVYPHLPVLVTDFYNDSLETFMKVKSKTEKYGQLMFQVFYQLFSILLYFKGKGVLHGDLQPSNLMIRYFRGCSRSFDTFTIMVTEFGSAQYLLQKGGISTVTNIGSVPYRDPLLVLGCPSYSYEADKWSVTISLIKLILLKKYNDADFLSLSENLEKSVENLKNRGYLIAENDKMFINMMIKFYGKEWFSMAPSMSGVESFASYEKFMTHSKMLTDIGMVYDDPSEFMANDMAIKGLVGQELYFILVMLLNYEQDRRPSVEKVLQSLLKGQLFLNPSQQSWRSQISFGQREQKFKACGSAKGLSSFSDSDNIPCPPLPPSSSVPLASSPALPGSQYKSSTVEGPSGKGKEEKFERGKPIAGQVPVLYCPFYIYPNGYVRTSNLLLNGPQATEYSKTWINQYKGSVVVPPRSPLAAGRLPLVELTTVPTTSLRPPSTMSLPSAPPSIAPSTVSSSLSTDTSTGPSITPRSPIVISPSPIRVTTPPSASSTSSGRGHIRNPHGKPKKTKQKGVPATLLGEESCQRPTRGRPKPYERVAVIESGME